MKQLTLPIRDNMIMCGYLLTYPMQFSELIPLSINKMVLVATGL